MATPTVTTTATIKGIATHLTRARGVTPIKEEQCKLIAATGDIVRPAEAAMATTAPTSTGLMPMPIAGCTKNSYRLCVAPKPGPDNAAKQTGKRPAMGNNKEG